MAGKTKKGTIEKPYSRLSGKSIKLCLVVSGLLHIGLLMVFQKAFPITWLSEPLKTYEVKLIRPPMDLSDDRISGAEVARIKPEKSRDKAVDTISLDTKDERYSSYAAAVKQRLGEHWRYPPVAKDNLMEGRVLILFSLKRTGELLDIKMIRPSNFKILDRETARAIQASAPFPPFPGSVTVKRLNIKASFEYKLSSD